MTEERREILRKFPTIGNGGVNCSEARNLLVVLVSQAKQRVRSIADLPSGRSINGIDGRWSHGYPALASTIGHVKIPGSRTA